MIVFVDLQIVAEILAGWLTLSLLVACALSYWFRYQRGDFDKRP